MLVTQPPHHFCEIITVSETCIAGNFVIPFRKILQKFLAILNYMPTSK